LRAPVQTYHEIKEVKVMGFFSKGIQTMDELFVHTLRDIYYAEQKILQALPTMIENSANSQLRSAFEHHLAETQNHVRRVEEVFDMQDAEPKAVDCPAIDGILKEAKAVVGDVEPEDDGVLDAALIAAAQAVEHYEIARYGALIAWAQALGREDCASVLEQNLEEEKGADKKLTEIAESEVNAEASAA
jgi:ferritin-like metal-binding protein YciE